MAFAKAYLAEVLEEQGKLFDLFALSHPQCDMAHFIQSYLASHTRKAIDDGMAYVCTMSAKELWEYFQTTEGYHPQPGIAWTGFLPDWIGEFYALYQWHQDIPSAKLLEQVPLSFLTAAYPGLHDLELELAVRKVAALSKTAEPPAQ